MGEQVTRRSTWQCVTCLDTAVRGIGVQLHLNEGGIVYSPHILSNTPHITAAANGTHVCYCTGGCNLSSSSLIVSFQQRRVCFNTSHYLQEIHRASAVQDFLNSGGRYKFSLPLVLLVSTADQIGLQQKPVSSYKNEVVDESRSLVSDKTEEMESLLPRHPWPPHVPQTLAFPSQPFSPQCSPFIGATDCCSLLTRLTFVSCPNPTAPS